MKNILAISGSNSSTSINHRLLQMAASLISHAGTRLIRFSDYQLPLYSVDIEKAGGIPKAALDLKHHLDEADGFLIAVSEHNSSMSAFFKNHLDWLSRIHMSFFDNKPVALLSTSPGPGGGRNALAHTRDIVSGYLSARVVGSLSLPGFYQATDRTGSGGLGFRDPRTQEDLRKLIQNLEAAVLVEDESKVA